MMSRVQLILEIAHAERVARDALHALTVHVASLGIDSPVTQRAQSEYFQAYRLARTMRAQLQTR